MVFQAFLDASSGAFQAVLGVIAGVHLPDYALQISDGVGTLAGNLTGMGAWFDFSLGATVAAATLTVYVSCLVVKLVLRIVAFVPFVGGAG